MFNKTQKKIQMIKKEVECCQCHEKFCSVLVKPEEEENYRELFMMCPTCFAELCKEASKGGKK